MVYKKYVFLDDHQWLYEQLLEKSMKELAEELSQSTGLDSANLAGSIRLQSPEILY